VVACFNDCDLFPFMPCLSDGLVVTSSGFIECFCCVLLLLFYEDTCRSWLQCIFNGAHGSSHPLNHTLTSVTPNNSFMDADTHTDRQTDIHSSEFISVQFYAMHWTENSQSAAKYSFLLQ